MTQEERLELLAGVAGGVARIMGEDTEIVLYDLYKREVVFIANGHVTGRETGYRIDATVYQAIEGLVDEDGCLIGYGSQSAKGGNLRASHMIFRDDEGEPCAMLCFNQDISKYEAMMQYIGTMFGVRPINSGERVTEEAADAEIPIENYIQKVTQQAILRSIERMKPTDLNTKEGKLELLRRLKLQGVFNVRDVFPFVCDVLSVSQPTLYNYLREIRTEDETD